MVRTSARERAGEAQSARGGRFVVWEDTGAPAEAGAARGACLGP